LANENAQLAGVRPLLESIQHYIHEIALILVFLACGRWKSQEKHFRPADGDYFSLFGSGLNSLVVVPSARLNEAFPTEYLATPYKNLVARLEAYFTLRSRALERAIGYRSE